MSYPDNSEKFEFEFEFSELSPESRAKVLRIAAHTGESISQVINRIIEIERLKEMADL